MTGLNAPDSSNPLKYVAIDGSPLGKGNTTFLPPNSGVTMARNGF
jgi:hypothetical protein